MGLVLALLASARRQYAQQQQIAARGLSQARRAAPRGPSAVAQVVNRYQAVSVALTLEYAPSLLSEQGVSTDSTGRVAAEALVSGSALGPMVDKAASDAAFDRLVLAFIADAGRTAQSVDNATRPAVTGYVRSLTAPSCPRCAVLAGRVYRYSTGFLRHPRCDCLMTPVGETTGSPLVTQPNLDQIHGLSQADTQAINDGADLGQVVNVHRKQAGMSIGSSVIERAGRPTPAGIYRIAADKGEALALFRRFGYVL